MPYLQNNTALIHYTDSGPREGSQAIITLHGLSESHLYWSLPGITDRLIQKGYRVISMDMRGHGLTKVEASDKGYDADRIAGDIDAVAEHLGLAKFHLLTHATGGIVGFRYAMSHGGKLLSIMATDTGSATYPSDEYARVSDPDYTFPPVSETDLKLNQGLIRNFRGNTWGAIIQGTRSYAHKNVFLKNLCDVEDVESAFAMYTACSAIGDPDGIADFVESFFTDYDTRIKGLRGITCPVLMLLGEFDDKFIKPAERVAQEVPDCKHVVMKGLGHMTAIEDPRALCDELFSFLSGIRT